MVFLYYLLILLGETGYLVDKLSEVWITLEVPIGFKKKFWMDACFLDDIWLKNQLLSRVSTPLWFSVFYCCSVTVSVSTVGGQINININNNK